MKNRRFKYGLYYGGLSIVLFFIAYFVQPKSIYQPSSIYNIIGYLTPFIFAFLAARKVRAIKNGYLPFGETFLTAFLTIIIGGLMYHLVAHSMQNYFDPSLLQLNLEASKEISQSTEEFFGMSENEAKVNAEEEYQDLEGDMLQLGIMSLISSIIFNILLFGLFVAMIIAFIVKKDEPNPIV